MAEPTLEELARNVERGKDAPKEPPRSRGSKRGPGRPKKDDESAELLDKTRAFLSKTGALGSLVLPVTGLTFASRADVTARALVSISERTPWLRNVLKGLSGAQDYTDLAETLAATTTAVAVEFQRLPDDSIPAKLFGIDAIVKDVEEAERAEGVRPPERVEVHEEAAGGARERGAGGSLVELPAPTA